MKRIVDYRGMSILCLSRLQQSTVILRHKTLSVPSSFRKEKEKKSTGKAGRGKAERNLTHEIGGFDPSYQILSEEKLKYSF